MAINTAYINNLSKQVQDTNTCASLAKISGETVQVIQPVIDSLTSLIAKLSTLSTVPTTLTGVISWITAYIGINTEAITTATADLIAYEAALTNLLVQVENKIATLGCQLVNVVSGGTGYTVGNTPTVVNPSGVSDMVVLVTGVSPGGTVTSVLLYTSSSGYSHGVVYNTTSGTGTGLQVLLP